MDPFDPALHYGPNDAGVSALSIALVVIGIIISSWAFGAASALIGNYFKSKQKDNDQS